MSTYVILALVCCDGLFKVRPFPFSNCTHTTSCLCSFKTPRTCWKRIHIGRRHFVIAFLAPTMWLFFCKRCTFDSSTQSLCIWLGFVNVGGGWHENHRKLQDWYIGYHNLNCYWNYLSPIHHEMQCQIAFPKHLYFCFSMAYQDILLLWYFEIINESWIYLQQQSEPCTVSWALNKIQQVQ